MNYSAIVQLQTGRLWLVGDLPIALQLRIVDMIEVDMYRLCQHMHRRHVS